MQMKMPHTISAYVQATNARDNDAFGALFTQDAIVHDEGQEHRPVKRESSPSARPGTSIHPSSSTTSTSPTAPTSTYWPMGSPRPSTCCLPSARRSLGQRWITANAAMPGAVHTNFVRNMNPDVVRALLGGKGLVGSDVPLRWKTPQQGAATSVLLATSPLLKGVGGRYFEDCNEAVRVSDNNGYVTYLSLQGEAFTLAAGQPKRTGQSACSGRVTALRKARSAPARDRSLWFVPETFYA